MKRIVPVAYLRKRYRYCSRTGKITHRFASSKAAAGSEAGSIRPDGYRVIKVSFRGRRVQIMAHVAGWAMHHGAYAKGDVDHRDTIRLHNWITNLRPSTRSQNLANRNKVGLLPKGVTLDKAHKSKPYRAQLKYAGRTRYLGNYANAMKAHKVYMIEAGKVFGEFARA